MFKTYFCFSVKAVSAPVFGLLKFANLRYELTNTKSNDPKSSKSWRFYKHACFKTEKKLESLRNTNPHCPKNHQNFYIRVDMMVCGLVGGPSFQWSGGRTAGLEQYSLCHSTSGRAQVPATPPLTKLRYQPLHLWRCSGTSQSTSGSAQVPSTPPLTKLRYKPLQVQAQVPNIPSLA